MKDRLLASFTLSAYQRAQRLLRVSPLGDRTPSALMDEMRGLLGGHEPCFLFKTIFVDQLPEDVRPALVSILDTTSPRDLALLADKMVSALRPSVNVISSKRSGSGNRSSSRDKLCRFHKRWGAKAFRCEGYCSYQKNSQDPPNKSNFIHSVQGNEFLDHQ